MSWGDWGRAVAAFWLFVGVMAFGPFSQVVTVLLLGVTVGLLLGLPVGVRRSLRAWCARRSARRRAHRRWERGEW